MQIIETNLGLGYLEFARFIKVSKNKFLCIDENISDNEYKLYNIGEITIFTDAELKGAGIEKIPKQRHKKVIQSSPLYGTYLFDFFLKHFEKL